MIAAIAPWNWPSLIAIWQIIPSIRAGNTVVIKLPEHTSIGITGVRAGPPRCCHRASSTP